MLPVEERYTAACSLVLPIGTMTILLINGVARRCLAMNNAVGLLLRKIFHSQTGLSNLINSKAIAQGGRRNISCGMRSVTSDDVDISNFTGLRQLYNSDDTDLQRQLEIEVMNLAPDDAGKFVLKFWKEVEERNVRKSDKFYPFIFKALCKGGYLEEAFKLLNSLAENVRIISILPLCNFFLRSCIEMKSFADAYLCLEFMDRWMVGKNEVTYCELLELAVLQESIGAIHGIWQEYVKNYSVNILSLRKYVWSLARLNELQAAYEVLQGMVALALRDMNIKMGFRKLSPSKLDIPMPTSIGLDLVLCDVDKSPEKSICLIRFDLSSALAIRSAETMDVRVQSLDNYIFVMKILRHSFNDVIHACARNQNLGLAEELFLQMQNLGVKSSSRTFDGLIRTVISERGFRAGIELLKVMQLSNLRPCDSTLESLAVSCCVGLELDIADAIMGQISNAKSVHLYNTYLAACDKLDQPERALQALTMMKKLRLKPNFRTYELLFSLFGNVNAPYENGNLFSQAESAKRFNVIEMDMVRNGVGHSCISINNLLNALGAEGMIDEMMRYFHMAEMQFSKSDISVGPTLYNTVLHSLVEAGEGQIATNVFMRMRLRGIHPDSATYIIMIDCCSVMNCFKAAFTLTSLMLRDGFYQGTETYTVLVKTLLRNNDIDESMNVMRQAFAEGILLDVVLFNTILREASEKGRLDIVEAVVAEMHRHKIRPDSSTCAYIFSAYSHCGYFSTAVEALQVMSVLVLSKEEGKADYEHLILSEDTEAESLILELYEKSKEDIACALLSLRWCATLGSSISWSWDQSPWLQRLLKERG